jgi:hypothetical protein
MTAKLWRRKPKSQWGFTLPEAPEQNWGARRRRRWRRQKAVGRAGHLVDILGGQRAAPRQYGPVLPEIDLSNIVPIMDQTSIFLSNVSVMPILLADRP